MIETAIDVSLTKLMLERRTLRLKECLIEQLISVNLGRGGIFILMSTKLVSTIAMVDSHDDLTIGLKI